MQILSIWRRESSSTVPIEGQNLRDIIITQTYNQFKGIILFTSPVLHHSSDFVPIVTFKKFGIGVKFVTDDRPESFAAAIDDKTKAIYVESIGNPAYNVSPIPDIAKVIILLTFPW